MSSIIEKLGSYSGLGAIRRALLWDPMVTSTLLGAGLGAAAAGQDWRVRGAVVGGLGGLMGGLAGSGLTAGTARKLEPRKALEFITKVSPEVRQHVAGGLSGLLAGTLIQPKPSPLLLHGKKEGGPKEDVMGIIDEAKGFIHPNVPVDENEEIGEFEQDA